MPELGVVPGLSPATRVTLGGTAVDLLDREAFLGTVRERLAQGGPALAVASANLDHLNHFRGPLGGAGLDWLVTLDGRPLVWRATRLTGRPWPQLAGSALLPALLDAAEQTAARVGFLGGQAELHTRVADVLAGRWPALQVVGYWAPERRRLSDPRGAAVLAAEVRAAGADLLVVGLGKPRQERWIEAHGVATGARVLLGFGAAAEFLAGTKPRAPEALQRAGLEWAFRLALEPRRLARRYLVEGPPAAYRLLTRSAA
jgi:N-acetylglucosaminyldiphosphoundecaprenol N-acetyl-beta-D-mannosaminyltransferase